MEGQPSYGPDPAAYGKAVGDYTAAALENAYIQDLNEEGRRRLERLQREFLSQAAQFNRNTAGY